MRGGGSGGGKVAERESAPLVGCTRSGTRRHDRTPLQHEEVCGGALAWGSVPEPGCTDSSHLTSAATAVSTCIDMMPGVGLAVNKERRGDCCRLLTAIWGD